MDRWMDGWMDGGSPKGEVDQGVQLVPHVAAVGEPLEVDHQDRGQRPQVQLLSGLLVLLTGRTVPTHTRAR